ncbi:MAG: hydrogenase formation protein HypD [Methylococcus sp.]|nr:hydrogenase formation protein HypD [Methylococcus sp.]
MSDARLWLERIRALPIAGEIRIMNVCGGHERSISMAGLRTALPPAIRLIPGPGCPVCICPEEDIYQAIQLGLRGDAIVASFGDMLRVPVNVGRQAVRSLEQAKAAGADIRPIASPIEARMIAEAADGKPVVLFAVGFETTMAPIAALMAEGLPDNLYILCSGRLTWPAVKLLLDSEECMLDALVAPGHVATVMGPEEWAFVAEDYRLPVAIAGFTSASLLQAIHSALVQWREGAPRLDNCYPEVVRPLGNPKARDFLDRCFEVSAGNWRGIGPIAESAYVLKPEFAAHDARRHFSDYNAADRSHAGEMPAGCDCARVVLGKIQPADCRIYGQPCTPRTPVGPCMVSDEGACRIWWAAGVRKDTAAA